MQEILDVIKQYIPTVIQVLSVIVAVFKLIKDAAEKNKNLESSFTSVINRIGDSDAILQKVSDVSSKISTDVSTMQKSVILLSTKIEKLETQNKELYQKLKVQEEEARKTALEEIEKLKAIGQDIKKVGE